MNNSSKSVKLIFIDKTKRSSSNARLSKTNTLNRPNNNSETFKKLLLRSHESKKDSLIDNYKGPLGAEAKIDFYNSFKKLPSITERNQYENLENSPNVAYLQETARRKLSPHPFGIMRRGKESSIDLNGHSMGDNYAEAFSEGLQYNTFIEKVNLNNNRLTERGANSILTKLISHKLRELNLSNNKIGFNSINSLSEIVHKDSSVLSTLNLENIGLKEKSLAQLISSVKINTSINYLNLAKNSLNTNSAKLLKELLEENYTLKKLDLH